MHENSINVDKLIAKTFVRAIHHQKEMESTNDVALQLAKASQLVTPLLVIADSQSSGRGRGQNRWWAGSGSLTFSLILETQKSQLPSERWPQISLMAGMAVCRTLQHLHPGIPVGLKWPNDVFVRDRKICGILIEVPSAPVGRVVMGIGVNVNNSFAVAPDELCHIATSLVDECERNFAMTDVLICLLQRIEEQWIDLGADHEHIARHWDEYCILTGCETTLDVAGRQVKGVCLGIDEQGALRIDTGTEIEHHFAGHIVEFQ